jgi:pyridoxamine 5'-phosphate oxidase
MPQRIEFWQGGENRLHDRFRYLRRDPGEGEGEWEIVQLQP